MLFSYWETNKDELDPNTALFYSFLVVILSGLNQVVLEFPTKSYCLVFRWRDLEITLFHEYVIGYFSLKGVQFLKYLSTVLMNYFIQQLLDRLAHFWYWCS